MSRRISAWLRQAAGDLEMAALARHHGRHDWACFAAQQAAEKAMTALDLASGREPAHSHDLVMLARCLAAGGLGELTAPPLPQRLRQLAAWTIAARYPTGREETAPADSVGAADSAAALATAATVLDLARRLTGHDR